MPGPKAKHPSVRARRNTTTTKAKLKVPEKPVIPPLPEVDGVEWHPLAKAWWTEAWSSPMRAEWADVDVYALYRAALLTHTLWTPDADGAFVDVKEMKAISAELRLIEAQFGLTAMSRRSLQWELPKDDDEGDGKKSPAKKAAPRKRAAKKADPRAAFQVVNGGKAS